ncbi:tRNA (adenosine(37)-N6)-dimethylallyltransferase MiaA [Synechococcus sp. M16CYN]
MALELAERLGLSVINVDSRQLYREMDIGTSKPTPEQQARVTHHLLDLRDPNQPMTLQEFQAEATSCIERELDKKGIALLAGGSGLYLKSLTSGLQPPAVAPQPELRKQFSTMGQPICHLLLAAADPIAAAKISPADAVRTQRALEVLYASGELMSRQATTVPPPWRILELGLNPANLQARIEQRTGRFYQEGLIEETQRLAVKYGADLSLLQTIGYGEALRVIDGSIAQASAIAITNRRTQRLAKRQRTWFRHQHSPHWLNDSLTLTEAMTQIERQLV